MHGIFAPLIAIYNRDSTVLDGLKVPKKTELPEDIEYIDPIPELSDSTLKNQLLFSLGELCPVYTDPDVLKQMIKMFNDVYHSNFLTLWQTTLYKFNPIWNKDGTYTETRNLTAGKTNSEQSSGSSSENLTTGNSETFSETTGMTFSGTTGMTKTGSVTESRSYQDTVLHNVTGFDTNSLSPAYNDETNGVDGGTTTTSETDSGTSGSTTSGSGTGSKTGSGTGSKTGSTSGSKSGAEDLSESETWTKRETGNIGVTTTQQMIREQREIVTFNMYTYIIELFKKELMVQVY